MTIAFYGNDYCQPVKQPLFANIESIYAPVPKTIPNDSVEISKPQAKNTEPPKIGLPRILFHRLKKEQIAAVNESGQLPKNAKFVEEMGSVKMTWNLADITTGTHTLPAGYELKNDILGFTHVVRKDTKNIFMK